MDLVLTVDVDHAVDPGVLTHAGQWELGEMRLHLVPYREDDSIGGGPQLVELLEGARRILLEDLLVIVGIHKVLIVHPHQGDVGIGYRRFSLGCPLRLALYYPLSPLYHLRIGGQRGQPAIILWKPVVGSGFGL